MHQLSGSTVHSKRLGQREKLPSSTSSGASPNYIEANISVCLCLKILKRQLRKKYCCDSNIYYSLKLQLAVLYRSLTTSLQSQPNIFIYIFEYIQERHTKVAILSRGKVPHHYTIYRSILILDNNRW